MKNIPLSLKIIAPKVPDCEKGRDRIYPVSLGVGVHCWEIGVGWCVKAASVARRV